jgi:hypothetical protein
VRAPDIAFFRTGNEFRVAKSNIERPDDGFHAFLQVNELHSKVVRLQRSFPVEIAPSG